MNQPIRKRLFAGAARTLALTLRRATTLTVRRTLVFMDRRAAMTLLLALLTTATAWATTTSTITVGGTDYTLFTGFTATDGNGRNYANLVDGNTSTDWIATKNIGESTKDFAGGTEDPAFVEFRADEAFIPKGYILTCDRENAGFWKPVEWALKAKLNEGDDWTTIHSSNTTLGAGKTFEIACSNDGDNEYQYFRFEVYEVGSTYTVNLDELQIYAQFTYTPVSARAATCTEYGLENDGYLRNDGKYFSEANGTTELTVGNGLIDKIPHTGVHHEASDSNIEYWQCSMCHKYFTDKACTQEVTADEVLKGIFGTLTAGTNGSSGYYTLESKTYTLTEDVNTAGYIYVPEGVTATIDLAGHTIDRGLTSAITNGMVIWVAGSLTVTDSGTGGKIKGGMDSKENVSCVMVYSDNGGAAFTLQGGTLIGNTSYQYNSAVLAPTTNASITISGGKITGGVYGIFSRGNVAVTGGEISGNTTGISSVNYSVSVSGNPAITNNTNANVVLYYGDASVLTIAGELTDGANIGITKGGGSKPTDNAPVTITSGYGTYNNNVSPSTYFSLDNNGQIQTGESEYMTLVMGWNEDKTEIAVGTAMRTVSFDLRGHGSDIDAVSLLSGYKLIEPTEPTAEGWSFGGWYTDANCTDGNEWDFNNSITSDKTLYALWAQGQTYRVTLPENMIIVSADNEAVGGKYPTGTNIRFKVKSADYVVDGDMKNGDDVLTADGDGIYTVTVADADITITATVKKAAEPNKTLSGSESYTAQDGDVLTGSTSGTVTIASGASITLSDVAISGGIVCEGTATITLVGTNSVMGASQKAGIQVGGSGTALTIRGNGSLTANGGNQSAGIGLSRAWGVDAIGGNIVIEGGDITANGGSQWGAGIGTGVIYGDGSAKTARIGNITIKGGTVKATGGTSADGIGTGYTYSGCTNAIGTVTIYDGINMVDASSIKDFASVVYMHDETDVTTSKTDYFSIGEDGNRRLIVQKPMIAEVDDQTYTGSEITPEPLVVAGSLSLTKGTDYIYSYTNNTNVGTATVRASFQGTYASLGYVERTFNIGKGTPTVTAPTPIENLVYTGSALALVTAGSADFGTLVYSLEENGTYSADIPTATAAGDYTVYYKVEASDNWNAVDAASVAVTIAPRTYTVTFDANGGEGTMEPMQLTYDGDWTALTANTFTRTGYGFKGWNTEAGGSGTNYDNEEMVQNLTDEANGNVVLYAQWGEDIASCEIRGTLEAYDDGYGPYNQLAANVEVWDGDTQLTLDTDYTIELAPNIDIYSYVVGEQYQATVIGAGDWGGTKAFTFTMVALHHTIVFDANGGSGTMAGGTVANDGGYSGRYYLPVCGFTAPDGKVFDHWVVDYTGIEENPIKQPGDYFTAPYIYNVSDVQTITVTAHWRDALILLDDDSNQPAGSKNADIIATNDGTTDLTVQLQGRTLYKDGKWNTLCLPFALSAAQIEAHTDFSGATLMELDTDGKNGFDTTDGTLWLTFKTATAIAAGVPYLVKWSAGADFTSPTFSGVTIDATASTTVSDADDELQEVQMVGCYSPAPVEANDKSILFLGNANTLYYSTIDRDIRSCRAYFSVPYIKQHAGAKARAFRLDFGEGEQTGITTTDFSDNTDKAGAWYDMSGRRLSSKPTKSGVYVSGGRKIVIK